MRAPGRSVLPVLLAVAGCTSQPAVVMTPAAPPVAVAALPGQLDFDRDGVTDVDDRFPYDARLR